ncbi:MAG: glycosyltransferase [Clostridia bacterium]|nr:glycosyltransferase [Clostridia bacterium]
MAEQLKFSVSMCVYGRDNPDWFQVAVDSILNQTCPPDEVVLVVDGPVPEALDGVIAEYEKLAAFKVIRFAENRGHGNARRAGLENCSHNIVALMDADDISVPDRFERQLAEFERDEHLDIVGGAITEFIDEPQNAVGQRVVLATDEEIKRDMKTRCPMNQMTVMFRKDSVQRVGGYVDWYCDEDYYLWIRMLLADMRFANIPDTLVYARVGKEMYQRRGGVKYFKSEARLQKYMRKQGVIGFGTYLSNVLKRLIVQVLLPNRLRGWVFKKFARRTVN